MSDLRYEIGIDEAGRGPLAGPVAVGVVLVPVDFDWRKLANVNDSKKLTEKKRDELYRQAVVLRKQGQLDFAVVQTSAKKIDAIGIVSAVKLAMERALRKVQREVGDWSDVVVKLDGGLVAPEYCVYQETIIKGDAKEKVIGLASVVAKVTRDRYMCQQAKKPVFSLYQFAQHKGYGTKVHRSLIEAHGLSTMHRESYCKNVKVL